MPVTQPPTGGCPKATPYQSPSESIIKASKKSRLVLKTTSSQRNEENVHVKVKEKRQCGHCGLRSGSWYDSDCTLMSETCYLVKKSEVDNFRIKLTYCHPDT